MKIITAEFKNQFEQYINAAEIEPIIIEKSEHKKFVLISYDMYKDLLNDNKFWIERYDHDNNN